MSARRSLTIADKDGDELTIREADRREPHALEVDTANGSIVFVSKPDLDELRSFLLSVAARP